MDTLYLKRYAWQDHKIAENPLPGTQLIVVIPCYNEPDVLSALDSLYNCTPPKCRSEVIIVVNHGKNASGKVKERNRETINEIRKWRQIHKQPYLSFHVISAFDLPDKEAGVGLARKIGMDEAVRRFESIHEKKGIIACFDADCACSTNYLSEIHNFYTTHPEANAGLVYFEHDYKKLKNNAQRQAIINYELHLRYYKNALKFARFPYAFHTVGSCITVTAAVYQKQGGMNKKKAGEDFYFLQKIFPLGGVYNINTAKVMPSCRPSDRVPFGTGKAVTEMLNNGVESFYTYNPKSFADLKKFNEVVAGFWHKEAEERLFSGLPFSIRQFLDSIGFLPNLNKIRDNSGDQIRFEKAFYRWFNGFKALKFIHFSRDNFYENIEILEAVNWLLKATLVTLSDARSEENALILMREMDKSDNGDQIFYAGGS